MSEDEAIPVCQQVHTGERRRKHKNTEETVLADLREVQNACHRQICHARKIPFRCLHVVLVHRQHVAYWFLRMAMDVSSNNIGGSQPNETKLP